MLRKIAKTPTEKEQELVLSELKSNVYMKGNRGLREWFEKKWLKETKVK